MGIIADIHEDLEKGALQLIVEYRGRLQAEAVREALNRIDPKYREALVLHYFKDYSFKEIAGILNLPLGMVGRRIQIARQILAERLQSANCIVR